MNEVKNVFDRLPEAKSAEVFETLLQEKGIKLERIVSEGQVTPTGEWLVSAKNEWVLVLRGAAKISFHGEVTSFNLAKGDTLLIPANTKHRVQWTDPTQPTLWLALHY